MSGTPSPGLAARGFSDPGAAPTNLRDTIANKGDIPLVEAKLRERLGLGPLEDPFLHPEASRLMEEFRQGALKREPRRLDDPNSREAMVNQGREEIERLDAATVAMYGDPLASAQIAAPAEGAAPAGAPGAGLPPLEDDDKRLFLQCFLAGAPFSKTYSLFGGHLQVGVRVAAELDRRTARAQASYEYAAGFGVPQQTYMLNMIGGPADDDPLVKFYELIACISSWRRGTQSDTFPPLQYPIPLSKEQVQSGNMGAIAQASEIFRRAESLRNRGMLGTGPILQAVQQIRDDHELLAARLAAEANNPDFWSGIAP